MNYNQIFSMHARRGQSLIEILIALGVGALLIGAASVSIAFVVRSSSQNVKQEIANRLNQELQTKVQTIANARFNDLYFLQKGSSSRYFVYASGSELRVSTGTEGIANDAPQGGLVGSWGLDEGSGNIFYDASGQNNIGGVVGTVSYVTSSCKIGYCVDIPGEDYIQANIAGSPVLTSFSLTGWAKLISGQDGGLFSVRAGGNGSAIGVDSSGRPGGRVINAGLVRLNLTAPSTISVYDNKWHHIVLTFDGSTRLGMLYVDSVVRATGTASNGITGATDYVRIGKDMDDYWSNWDGTLDEPRVYSRALSASEVSLLWNSPAFQRYFYVEDVCRSKNDGSNTGVHSCNSTTEFSDPSTLRVTNVAEWQHLGAIGRFMLTYYLTRWKNTTFQQKDWSGGGGVLGPVTVPGSSFFSSTNIDSSSSGAIRIQGL